MDKVVSLCKRRGFVFQSREIYGDTLGVELKTTASAPGGATACRLARLD
jgi:hypothetical protein